MLVPPDSRIVIAEVVVVCSRFHIVILPLKPKPLLNSDGILDGDIWVETKAKSQKAVNLLRDPRVSFLIEDGMTYDTLRGVSFEGVAEIVDDPDTIFRVGVSVWKRYNGPYTDDLKPAVDMMMNKRVAVRIVANRTRSWDHRKLGMPPMPLAGSTAPVQ